MLYTDIEALAKFNRIQELMDLYPDDLNLVRACIRVGVNPASYGSLKKRVDKIRLTTDEKAPC